MLEVAKQRALHEEASPASLQSVRWGMAGISWAAAGRDVGLRWQDVNIRNQRLTVARSYEALPKSGKPRTLPIPAALLEELSVWKEKCAPSAVVCPLGKMGMTAFQKLLLAAECPYFTRPWHALRHTFATSVGI